MAEIVVKFEDKIVERVVTEKKQISIGRTHENDIVLENRGVSRKHALIEFNNKSTLLIDNESLNGTFLNNRKISEEVLRNEDVITIGKYSLVYHEDTTDQQDEMASIDGTVVLKTKKQKEMIKNDQLERQIIARHGGTVLTGEENADFSEYRLDREVTTIGKAKFVHIKAKGFLLSGIQAKIVKDDSGYTLMNLGRRGKTAVNGELVEHCRLKNGDYISVGKTTFRLIEGEAN